jgi:hypothetical protein
MKGQSPEISPTAAYSRIGRRLGLDFSQANRIFLALENIHELQDRFPKASQIRAVIEARLSQQRAELLAQNGAAFEELLGIYPDEHPLHISFKAEKLSYLHENLYQDGEIITDVRPVFDGSGDTIREMVVAHSLVVAAWSYDRPKRIHFAMDARDVLRLRDACDRAIRKANAIKGALGGNAWTVKVLNDDDDAS